jgi:hypothetical protein
MNLRASLPDRFAAVVTWLAFEMNAYATVKLAGLRRMVNTK